MLKRSLREGECWNRLWVFWNGRIGCWKFDQILDYSNLINAGGTQKAVYRAVRQMIK